MTRSTVLMILGVLAAAPPASAACRSFGTQLECDVGSSRVLIGTQTAGQPSRARSLPILSLYGDAGFGDDAAPPRGLQIQLQDFGTDPQLCRKIGNETYCY